MEGRIRCPRTEYRRKKVCLSCGGANIQELWWIDTNTREPLVSYDKGREGNYCCDCEKAELFVTPEHMRAHHRAVAEDKRKAMEHYLNTGSAH